MKRILVVAFVVLGLGVVCPLWAQPDSTQEVYEYVMQWGTTGSDTGQFSGPCGMCIDDTGYIYVCDRWNNRIQKFTRNGLFVLMWGRYGTGQGEFNEPYDIAADHSGYVYVNDAANYRIQKFDSRGNFILMWADTAAGLDVGPSNFLYIADGGGTGLYESLRVYDTLGNHLRSFGNSDTASWLPGGVAVDDSEFIYVSRSSNSRANDIVKFDSSGNVVLRWGRNGTGDGEFDQVHTLCSGRLATAEKYKLFAPDAPLVLPNYRVQKFTSGGIFVTKWGSRGTGNGQFMYPFSVVVDSEGYAYVSDPEFGVNRIQKFRKTVVGVEVSERGPVLKKRFRLQVLSPVRGEFVVRYSLPGEEEVKIGLFDLSGRKVQSLLEEVQKAGEHELRKNLFPPSGVYFLVLESSSGRAIAKVVQIR
jgi:hypothetical protein